MKRYKTDIDNSFESTTPWRNFIQAHSEIDEGIELRKAKNKQINKVFLIVDSVLVSLILSVEGILEHEFINSTPHSEDRY